MDFNAKSFSEKEKSAVAKAAMHHAGFEEGAMKSTVFFMLPFFGIIAVVSISIFTPSCNFSLAPLFNDSLPVPPNVLSKKDSLAVRAILDANGLDTVTVRDVISLSNSRITSINLGSRNLTRFTFTYFFDSLLINTGLDLSHNQIDTLLFLDSINLSFGIGLEYNNLRTIPDDIDKMRGNLALYFNNNKLTSISPNILHCNVGYINVRYNHLVSVPDSIAALLTSKDGPWMNYQTP